MERPGSGSIAVYGPEPQPRGAITRSSSSQPLLESGEPSHCVVGAAVGEKAGTAAPGKAATVAFHHEEEMMMMAGRERVVAVAGREKPFSSGAIVDGRTEQVKISSVWGYVGRLFHNKNSSVGVSSRESDASSSSQEEEEKEEDGGQEKEGKKAKKKKRSSWLPDPDKRWPIQGFY